MNRAHLLYLLLLGAALPSCTCGKSPPPKSTLKHEGEPCTTDDSCDTGLCDGPGGVNPKCVRKCATGCTVTEVCTQLTPGRFACQVDPRGLCKPCTVDSDCPYPADHCVVVNGENVCGRDCAFDQGCPDGYQCVNGKGVDGITKVEQCTPKDASCACLQRGDFNQPCTNVNGFGSCNGKKTCDLVTNDVVCDAATPAAETCNNLDDNCNGTADEGLGSITCGVGACKTTASACVGGDAGSCTPGLPTAELCNGIDDDCDGTVDNGFNLTSDINHCGTCTNVCMLPNATPMCTGGMCKVASCNPHYGDCNHVDADGCEVPTDSDPNNCGMCGKQCVENNAVASCVGGMCQFTCATGFVDLDGDPSNGCEYACTFVSSTDVPDLSVVDANCDGIDGELTNGIFVALNGNDANAGTRAAPVATISKAASLLITTGKRDLYIAGTGGSYYDGPLELLGVSGVNVAGGYDPITWKRSLATQTTIHGGNPALKLDGSSNVLVQALRFEGADGVNPGDTAYGAFIRDSQTVKLESLNLNAGNGANGSDGTAGDGGTPGQTGTPGDTGCVDDLSNVACIIQFGNCNRPAAGSGGSSSCGFPGGVGGQPTHALDGGTGDPGLAAPNGSGAGGLGVPQGKGAGPAGAPYNGKDGTDGVNGTNGAGAAVAGNFSTAGFTPSVGLKGGDGTNGKAAGGGGGGGGAQLNNILWTCDAWGSGGGGGGGAGCAGLGGFGGLGGGGSLGLFLSNSTVSAQSVVVKAGNGGKGGNGGPGGSGGPGGTGGPSQYDSNQGNASIGGNGGKGGNGGSGGNGGGGAGGSVYGLARSNNSTWNAISGTSFTLGTTGSGGLSQSGQNGVSGTSSIQTTW